MSGRRDNGASVPLPSAAPDHLADFVAGRSAMVRLDTSDIGWLGGQRTGAPLLGIRPGATASTVTLSVAWGLAAVPSPEVFLAIVNGHLSIDATQVPSGLRADLEAWVEAFNRQMSANNRELASFGVDGAVLEVRARAPQEGTFAPLSSAGVLGLAAAAAALWPRPSPGAAPTDLPPPGGAPPPIGTTPTPGPFPQGRGKPIMILVPLIVLLTVGGFAIAWWNFVGDDSSGRADPPDSTPVVPETSDSGPATTDEDLTTSIPDDTEPTTPSTSEKVESKLPLTTPPSPPSTGPPCGFGYPPQPCSTTPLSPSPTTETNGNVSTPPSAQSPTEGSDVNSPGQAPSDGDVPNGPGSATDGGEPDLATIPATGSDTGTTLLVAAFSLLVGLSALHTTRRRKPEEP